eukprot:gene14674-5765_t
MSKESNVKSVVEEVENGEELEAPSPSKKRGRRKREAVVDTVEEVEETSPPKRGRGRPRKYPPTEKKVPSGRPRGRPKGTGGPKDPADVPLASEKAKSGRRPRGRPSKGAKTD